MDGTPGKHMREDRYLYMQNVCKET